ncbi:EXS family-domain-containing protein [Lophiotrema nucula]|uniref:EXS family-domain-containing protein n=1 Tax=Lophiotrema nucula TaxID=690887 RepID=A0A6A5Z5I2_9PLEO|nr:EXS family-domain-containing protein [Lophiotrema nucula]
MIINLPCPGIWDVFMDWSLGDTTARHRFLRKHLGYKKVWMYYVAMIIDPILRFNWIPYAILPLETQHSTTLSFGISLSEVCRRGLWTLFRVENEHCTNVGRFRASRDIPLPYDIPSPSISTRSTEEEERASHEYEDLHPQVADHEPQGKDHSPKQKTHPTPPSLAPTAQGVTTSTDLEAQRTRSSTHSHRRRPRASTLGTDESPLQRGLTRVGTIIRTAHAQDFERRRKPELGKEERNLTKDDEGSSDEDDDDDDEEEESGGLTDNEEEEIHSNVEIGKGHDSAGE